MGALPKDYIKMPQVLNSIDDHLLKSIDKTVIDLTGLTPDQKVQILYYIGNLDPTKIIVIGL